MNNAIYEPDFMIRVLWKVLVVAIITLLFLDFMPQKVKLEQACIDNYKFIIKKDGTPHQVIDKLGQGIPCDDLEIKK